MQRFGKGKVIRFTGEAMRLYRDSIAMHPPETVALLGGRLDDPFLITEFKFLPPRRHARGGFDASSVHVNVDHELMNWIIDNEWKPAGKYMLGMAHSHPGDLDRPSRGDPASNEGDEVFFKSCLDHDDSPRRNWRYFLAPITTFDARGRDTIHGWVMRRGRPRAERCDVVVEEDVRCCSRIAWKRPGHGDPRGTQAPVRWRGAWLAGSEP
jgi:hypothetical protein